MLGRRSPGLEQRVGGIFTFGAPCFCNAGAAALMSERFLGRVFRYVNAADLVHIILLSFTTQVFRMVWL